MSEIKADKITAGKMPSDYVPYIVYESAMSRLERTIKRLVVALIVTIILMFATNAIWLYFWNQYEYIYEDETTSTSTTSTVTVDGKDGIANYIGNDGNINNGESGSDQNDGR